MTMESNILHELAAFDVRAPINFSISFEDSNEGEEDAVKTDNVTDDNNTNSQNMAQFSLRAKKELNEQSPEANGGNSNTNLKSADQQYVQNILKETTPLHNEITQNEKIVSNGEERKRKQKQLDMYQHKRGKGEQTSESESNHTSSCIKETENLTSNYDFTRSFDCVTNTINMTAATNPLSTNGSEITVPSYLSRLDAVSENMRLIMEAYTYHKQYNTPIESFNEQKFKFFQESYNTVIELLAPEEKNRRFVVAFLHKTYQYSLRNPGLKKYIVHDYAVLLRELINWAKHIQRKSMQSILDHVTNEQQKIVQHETVLPNTLIDPVNSDNTKTTLDSNIKDCRQTKYNFTGKNNKVSVPNGSRTNSGQTQVPFSTQPNNRHMHLLNLLQKPSPIMYVPPLVTSPNHLHHEMCQNVRTVNAPVQGQQLNKDVESNIRLPQVQKLLCPQNGPTMPGHLQHLSIQSMPRMLSQTQQSAKASYQPSSVQSQSQALQQQHQQMQSRNTNSQHLQPHYNYLESTQQLDQPSQIMPQCNYQFGNYQKVQSNIKSTANTKPPPPYRSPNRNKNVVGQFPSMQSVHGQFQTFQNENGQYPSMHLQNEQFQPLQNNSEQLQNLQGPNWQLFKYQDKTELRINMQPQQGQFQVHKTGLLQNVQPNGQIPTLQSQLSVLPQHVSPQIGQPSPDLSLYEQCLQIDEQRQGSVEVYSHQGVTQQFQKNNPRSSSTDSGFASPLNFNTPSDQMVPPVPDNTETPQILITHVTSLNPNASLMMEGNCAVCKSATRKVCLGCIKVYYCTYECQALDWSKHEPECYSEPVNNNNIKNGHQLQP